MYESETSGAPATHSGELFVPMSKPCWLCLPMHSSCDQTTCPSLLLFSQRSVWNADEPLDDEYWIISTSISDLEMSASVGCSVCATLYTGLMTQWSCHGVNYEERVTVARNGHVRVKTRGWMITFTDLGFFTTRNADESRKCVAFPDLTGSQSTGTGSDLSLKQIKQWLQRCQTHPHCLSLGDPVLPTRVLDIGDLEAQDLKLVQSNGKLGQYVALSHCWGVSPMIRTTSATIAERMRGIPFSQLPKTFQEDDVADWQRESAQMASIYANAALTIAASASQDSQGGFYRPTPKLSGSDSWEIAVEYKTVNEDPAESMPQCEFYDVNRHMEGIRWLDEDEMREHWRKGWKSGGQVRSTLNRSTLRCSAMRYLPAFEPPTALPSGKPSNINTSETKETKITGTKKQSYQAQRPPNFLGRIQTLEHSTGVYVRELPDHVEFQNVTFDESIVGHPLGSRAWALQERLLSTRILHFTASELVWECNSEASCQCGTAGSDRMWRVGDLNWLPTKPLKLEFDHAIREAAGGNTERVKEMWGELVSLYTAKSITHQTDRLPAVSGLMKRLQQINSEECFAGMWRKYLPEHMRWSVSPFDNAHARHETYVAPTWSWASITAPVHFQETLTTSTSPGLTVPRPSVVAEIIDVQYALAGLDPTGSLSDGVLTIHAPTLPAILVNRWHGETEWDSPNHPERDESKFRIEHPHKKASAEFNPDSVSDIDTSVREHDVLCIQWTKQADLEPIMEECETFDWTGTGPVTSFTLYAEFLVVRKSSQRPGKYERIGLVTLETDRISVYPENHSVLEVPIDKWFEGATIQTLDLI